MSRLDAAPERLIGGLSSYGFSTAEIHALLGLVLPESQEKRGPSGRTIKKRRRMTGELLKAGRRKVTGRVKEVDMESLAVLVHANLDFFSDNFLHLLHAVKVAFGLEPAQLHSWLEAHVRRGGVTLRRCLHCKQFFVSHGPDNRVGPCCRERNHRLIKRSRGSFGEAEQGF